MEFPGLSAGFRGDSGDMIGSLALSENEIAKIVELVEEMAIKEPVAAAAFQKLAGELCFTQTAILGTFGRAALKPIYKLIAKKGEDIPRSVKGCLRWRAFVLPTMAPRLISSLRHTYPADPVRICSVATGAGKLASISLFSRDARPQPTLLVALADEKLQAFKATSNKLYIFALFSAAASVFQLRDKFRVREGILFAGTKLLARLGLSAFLETRRVLSWFSRCGRWLFNTI